MTRESLIERYEKAFMEAMLKSQTGDKDATRMARLLADGLDALRGPTREMVERMRGEWEAVPRFGVYGTACSKCGYSPRIRFFGSDFCPACGAPMTDESVDLLANRLEEVLKDAD